MEELPLYPTSGEGDHTFVWVEKRDLGTEEVARALARFAGVAARDVGYAGRKDRRAVARQHFSVPGLDPERALAFATDGARALRATRHPHKLRVGHLRGNRFSLRVGGCDPARVDTLRARLDIIERNGFANRFGRQRYGRDGDNPERARELLAGGSRRGRRHERFLLSALQAQVFDAVLDARGDPVERVELGDLAQVCASGGLFHVEDLDRETPRAARFEISATGPIFGTRALAPRGAPGEREAGVLERFGVPALLERARGRRLRGARRAFRARVVEPQLHFEGEGLDVRFGLDPGCYATVFLESLLDERVDDAPRGDRYPPRETARRPTRLAENPETP